MKKSYVSIFSLVLLLSLAGCNNQTSTTLATNSINTTTQIVESETTTSSITTTVDTSTNDNGGDDIIHETTVDVDFGSLKETGSLQDLEYDEDNPSKDLVSKARVNLINVINKDLTKPILNKIVSKGKVQIQSFEVQNHKLYNYLILGSKNIGNDGSESYLGELSFEFNKNIKEITFKVKGYHKFAFDAYPDSERKMNYDKDVKVDVLIGDDNTNKVSQTLPNNQTFDVPQTLINVKLENPNNIITIKNHDNVAYNRFFLEGLTLVYDE